MGLIIEFCSVHSDTLSDINNLQIHLRERIWLWPCEHFFTAAVRYINCVCLRVLTYIAERSDTESLYAEALLLARFTKSFYDRLYNLFTFDLACCLK